MRVLKQSFVFLILLIVVVPVFANQCDVLPININEKVLLNGELFILTSHGLIERGQIIDYSSWDGTISVPSFDKIHKILYFACCKFNTKSSEYLNGIYRLDLTKHPLKPKLLIKTKGGDGPSVSPNGYWLVFYNSANLKDVHLLNLKNNKLYKVINNFKYNPITWINNHQFFYNDAKNHLMVFDVNTMSKKDMKMNLYAPGAVTPDGKYILLSRGGKTILYGIKDQSKKTIIHDWINTFGMVWTSDGKGFLYQRRTWSDFFHLREIGGLFYYSLEKKKDVQLIKTFDLTGGFVVPPNINLKPVDNAYNRDLPLTKWGWIKKICK